MHDAASRHNPVVVIDTEAINSTVNCHKDAIKSSIVLEINEPMFLCYLNQETGKRLAKEKRSISFAIVGEYD